jgi:serine protease Do
MDRHDERVTPTANEPAPTSTIPAPGGTPTQRGRRGAVLGMVFALLLASSAGFFGGWLGAKQQNTNTTVEKQQVVLKTQGQVISKLASEVGPSVVSIETTTRGSANSLFGQRSAEQKGAGTGIIISEDGTIITNRHVVPAGTTDVAVVLSDGTRLDDVDVVGRTSQRDSLDVAFLKIKDTKGKKLTAARLGDSSKMQVGDPVVAIGNALGQFENTVTSGIVSGHGRSVQAVSEDGSGAENLENLFQTDAAINQGNSGGPLMNLDGEVIGINTAVATDSENIGFAIPINDVKGMVESVITKGKLERPYIGVVYISITADLAKEYNLAREQGAYIPVASEVSQDPIVNGGPAEKAGLQERDIIAKVGDQVIDEKHSITSVLGKYNVGDKVKLTVVRDGKDRTIDVTLGTAPSE